MTAELLSRAAAAAAAAPALSASPCAIQPPHLAGMSGPAVGTRHSRGAGLTSILLYNGHHAASRDAIVERIIAQTSRARASDATPAAAPVNCHLMWRRRRARPGDRTTDSESTAPC